MVRRYTSSFSRFSRLSSFFLVLFFSGSYERAPVCALRTRMGRVVAANTPVVYTNDLSRHTGIRRGEPVKKDQQWRRVNEKRTRYKRNDRLEENQ